MQTKHPTSFRLTPEAERLIKELAQKLGIPQSAVIEMAIRNFSRQERITMQAYEGSKRVYDNLLAELIELDGRTDLDPAIRTATIDAVRFAAQVAANVTHSLAAEENVPVDLRAHLQYR